MNEIFVVGVLLLAGIISAYYIHRTTMPSVVGWLIAGVVLGPFALKLLSAQSLEALGFISDITLGLIGVIIGLEITVGTLRRLGGGIIPIILLESFGAFLLVFAGVYLLTRNLPLALVMAALAPASDPAGTVAVLREYRAKGPLTKALLVVVGTDDALAIVIYVFAASFSKALVGGGGDSLIGLIGRPLLEILMAAAVGGVIGWTMGFFSQRIRGREMFLSVALGAIFICVGLSQWFHFSVILSTVVLGATLVNVFPRVSRRVAEGLEYFIQPFYVIFFVLAGAHLDLRLLLALGLLGAVYVICRSAGLIGGATLGAIVGREIPVIRKYLGPGILSQAGVAIGLAYLIVKEFTPLGPAGSEIAAKVITTVAATTIIFMIIGPILAKLAITKAGETWKM
jgi:Kef-type K+ transport system membrane component KefB